MSQKLPEENLIRDYLLGQLPDHEQDAVEERLLSDSQFLQTARMIEDELFDDYVMELLSESDRMRVETRLLTSAEQRRKLELIRRLWVKSNASTSAEQRSVLPSSRLDELIQLLAWAA